jgi:SAM-dependent methyltransferase
MEHLPKPGNRKADHHGKSTKLYDPEFESPLLRGIEESRPWNLSAEIAKRLQPTDRLLDVGCGTAVKILPLAGKVQEIVGLEPSAPMRGRAQEHIGQQSLENVSIVEGTAEHLPFDDESFDVVTSMLAPDDINEIYRVLKPGGYAVIEKLGERDKADLKVFFGSDEQGPRGQLCDLEEGKRLALYKEEYERPFSEVLVQEGTWQTYYSHEGLVLLLNNTSDVRNFNIDQDLPALEDAETALSTPNGIAIRQHRILVIARK